MENVKDSRSLMAKRLGISYQQQPIIINSQKPNFDSNADSTDIEGLELERRMLDFNGGHAQQDRMIRDKRRSLDRALKYSYQGADIKKVGKEDAPITRALINPNKLKEDYDDKVVSIGYEHGYQAGDVFQWVGTNSYWIIYLQNLTELAYFRADIRRCIYTINFLNKEGELVTVFAAVRGPVETKISTVNFNGISHDLLNNTVSLLIPKTEDTLWYFNRNRTESATSGRNGYPGFYLKSLVGENLPPTKWTVESANWVSMDGVIELTALEGYTNEQVDDLDLLIAQNYKKDTQKVEDFNSDIVEATIEGDTFIKPMLTKTYVYKGSQEGDFIIDGAVKTPVKIISKNANEISLKWQSTYSGQFKLIYREKYRDSYGIVSTKDIEKVIVVETLKR